MYLRAETSSCINAALRQNRWSYEMNSITIMSLFATIGNAMGVLPMCLSNIIELEAGLSLVSAS